MYQLTEEEFENFWFVLVTAVMGVCLCNVETIVGDQSFFTTFALVQ